jgi:hypothetical protein
MPVHASRANTTRTAMLELGGLGPHTPGDGPLRARSSHPDPGRPLGRDAGGCGRVGVWRRAGCPHRYRIRPSGGRDGPDSNPDRGIATAHQQGCQASLPPGLVPGRPPQERWTSRGRLPTMSRSIHPAGHTNDGGETRHVAASAATSGVNSLAGCTRQQDMQFGEPDRDRVIPGRSADS